MGAKDSKSGEAAKDGAAKNFGTAPLPQAKCSVVLPCKKKHWIGVRVVDEAGKPVSGITIKLKLTDGTNPTVASDKNGNYKSDLTLPDGSCDISFPDLIDVEWNPR